MILPAWRPKRAPRPDTEIFATRPSLSIISPSGVRRLESKSGSWASAPVISVSRKPRYLLVSVFMPKEAPTVAKAPYLELRSAMGRKPPVVIEICGVRREVEATSRVVWAKVSVAANKKIVRVKIDFVEFIIAKVGCVSSLAMQDELENIKMVDLSGMNARLKPEIDDAIMRVIASEKFIGGEEVSMFSEELGGKLKIEGGETPYVIPCANGTDALQIALMSLGIGAGDEVITPAFTFISTVEVVALLGAKPVLVDVYPDTFNMDCEAVEKAITNKTKAIIPVHLFGQCADMGRLVDISKRTGVPIVEDTAQSLMSIYCNGSGLSGRAGLIGKFGTTSFFPSKNLGCFGDGGALFTHDEELATKAKAIANHGGQIRYKHEIVGLNSRLDAIQAAILRVKLPYLEGCNLARQKAANIYDELLKDVDGIDIPKRDANSTHVFHQYTIKVSGNQRDSLSEALKEDGIPTGIYYPKGIHLQPAYKKLGYNVDDFPNTNYLASSVLSLPMHTELTNLQQTRIVERLISRLTK